MPAKQELFRLERIEEMRRQEGIDDVELREAIRGLEIDDLVRLTFLTGESYSAGETLLVKITSIRGTALRGTLVSKPTSAGLANLRIGVTVVFAAGHIHSLPGGRPEQHA